MSEETIRVQLLRPRARMPVRATALATGYDLYACIDAPVEVGPHPTVVGTGIALEIPPGLDVQVRPRSGLGRQGVLTTYGTIDADYRGELMINMYTMAPGIAYTVHDGDRIAQLVITRLVDSNLEQALVLSETARGAGGHGSTGR